MSTTSIQYRDLNHLYVFKQKLGDQITMKAYKGDERIYKQLLSQDNFKAFSLPCEKVKEKVVELLKQGFTPSLSGATKFIPPLGHSREKFLEKITQIVGFLRPKLILDTPQLEQYLCPITYEVFIEPMVDNHGHMFEKSAIENVLKTTKNCPVSRQPITALNPNLIIKNTIAELKTKAQVPQINFLASEKPNLAKTFIQNGLAYEEDGSYSEALESYTKALQYTRNIEDYLPIPHLLEKMHQHQAAALGYLYLAMYHWQAKEDGQALASLEKANYLYPNHPKILTLLVSAYETTGNNQKAQITSAHLAQLYEKESSEQTLFFYEEMLEQDPFCSSTYEKLIPLCPTPQMQAHFYLKAALHHLLRNDPLHNDRDQAQRFCKKAHEIYQEGPLVHYEPYLSILEQQNNTQEIEKVCVERANVYKTKESHKDMIKCYKILISLHPKDDYYSQLISAHLKLNQPSEALVWSIQWIHQLIQQKNWQKAEEIALSTLDFSRENPLVLEQLIQVYQVWQGHRLSDISLRLGKAHEASGNLKTATAVYRQAYKQFQETRHLLALIHVLTEQKQNTEAVTLCYEGTQIALVQNKPEDLQSFVKKIQQIDPTLKTLSEGQKNFISLHLCLDRQITDLTHQIVEQRSTIDDLLKEQTSTIRALSERLEKMEKLYDAEIRRKSSTSQQIGNSPNPFSVVAKSEDLVLETIPKSNPPLAFGAAGWAKYFGDVGVEAPLPLHIDTILASPCSFWPNKTVGQTHLLVWIPNQVNGKPLTLDSLSEIIQHPQSGGNATKYHFYGLDVGKEIGNQALPGHWVLMTRGVIPESRGQSYDAQCQLVATYRQKTGKAYEVPKTLEAAVSILMHHVLTGEYLYDNYTRCQEKFGGRFPVMVGGFTSAGLNVCNSNYDFDSVGVAALRKFC